MSNQSYASLGNYNGTQSSQNIIPMNPQYVRVNNSQNFGYDALSPNYNGQEYNSIANSYGSSCGNSLPRYSSCNAEEYYSSNNIPKEVKYEPVAVRGPWDQVKGLYELNPQADNCIVNKKSEYYKSKNELKILSADSFCGYCKAIKKDLDKIKKLLSEIGVDVNFISDVENQQKFKDEATKANAGGFPTLILRTEDGEHQWSGWQEAEKIRDKVKSRLNNGKNPEYYNSEHKLDIYGMDGCPHCVKVKKSLDEIKRLLKEIKVEVNYISSTEQPDKFKEEATKYGFRGFPAFCLDKGSKTWLGASGPDSIKKTIQDHLNGGGKQKVANNRGQKVRDHLNGGGKQKVANNRGQKSSGDNKNMVIVSADSWCSYSMTIRKELEQIKRALAELGVKVTYVSDKDNKSDFDEYSNKYNVRGYPTIIFDAGGELEDVWPGYLPYNKLKDRVEKHMKKHRHKKERKGSDDDVILVCISADDWCGYSQKLSATKNELSQKLGANGIKLNMVNATENKPEFDRLSKEHNVRGFPTCVLIVNGKKVVDISGYRPPEGMLQECMKNL